MTFKITIIDKVDISLFISQSRQIQEKLRFSGRQTLNVFERIRDA